MADENVKIFNAKGEYTMSDEDNFKTAKNISLDSALKNLDADIKNFLRDKFPNLDDDDIVKITEKFLTKNEPRFIRENLPNDAMIYYAEIDAQINLVTLYNFLKNFDVFKLSKKVDELQKIVESTSVKSDSSEKKIYSCKSCGREYVGDINSEPDDWTCPLCGRINQFM